MSVGFLLQGISNAVAGGFGKALVHLDLSNSGSDPFWCNSEAFDAERNQDILVGMLRRMLQRSKAPLSLVLGGNRNASNSVTKILNELAIEGTPLGHLSLSGNEMF